MKNFGMSLRSKFIFFSKIIQKGGSYLFFNWFIYLRDLLQEINSRLEKSKEEKKELPRRERRASKENCTPLKSPVYHRPDPLIYSQYYLMKLGFAVTWDNPDIQLYLHGVPATSESILPNTEYEIVATIHNASFQAPVVGMPVVFSYLDFGAGTSDNFIGQTNIDLSVLGGSLNPNKASVKWRTPEKQGHYCLQVKLLWGDDLNQENNLGQENVTIVEAHSPANFEFKVKNRDTVSRKFHFEMDTYTLPKLAPCKHEKRKLGSLAAKKSKRNEALAKHNRSLFEIPVGWKVTLDPSIFGLSANEEITIKASIEPPVGFIGKQPFNIHAMDENDYMTGGITVYVIKK